jgi:hypothetical protein
MVDTDTARAAAVREIQELLYGNAERFVETDPASGAVLVRFSALAGLVADLVTGARAERAGLWQLLKDQVRAVILASKHNSDLHLQNIDLRGEITRLRGELEAVRVERDEFARLARVRAGDVLNVIDERDRAEAQLAELGTGGPDVSAQITAGGLRVGDDMAALFADIGGGGAGR